MLRQFRRMLIEPPGVDLLHHSRDVLMQSDPAWRQDLFVERLLKERV